MYLLYRPKGTYSFLSICLHAQQSNDDKLCHYVLDITHKQIKKVYHIWQQGEGPDDFTNQQINKIAPMTFSFIYSNIN